MGKFYARGDWQAHEAIGIDLTNMNTVGLFAWVDGHHARQSVHLRLVPSEAFALARQLVDSAEFSVMDNCGCSAELMRDEAAHRKHHGFGPEIDRAADLLEATLEHLNCCSDGEAAREKIIAFLAELGR